MLRAPPQDVRQNTACWRRPCRKSVHSAYLGAMELIRGVHRHFGRCVGPDCTMEEGSWARGASKEASLPHEDGRSVLQFCPPGQTGETCAGILCRFSFAGYLGRWMSGGSAHIKASAGLERQLEDLEETDDQDPHRSRPLRRLICQPSHPDCCRMVPSVGMTTHFVALGGCSIELLEHRVRAGQTQLCTFRSYHNSFVE